MSEPVPNNLPGMQNYTPAEREVWRMTFKIKKDQGLTDDAAQAAAFADVSAMRPSKPTNVPAKPAQPPMRRGEEDYLRDPGAGPKPTVYLPPGAPSGFFDELYRKALDRLVS